MARKCLRIVAHEDEALEVDPGPGTTYVGNALALSKRSGISIFAASILSVPARHAAMGNWLFIA